jgi:P2 family phage contractile tail tube protein
MRAAFKEFPLGKFKKNDNAEFTTELAVYSFKIIHAGIELVEYDMEANIYKVLGDDLLAQYRANLGF